MVLRIRLNGDDTKIYKLVNWDASSFTTNLSLHVQGDDLGSVSRDFSEITKLEVFQDETLIGTYTDLDTYSEISFIKNEYVPGEGIFSDALCLRLTRTNIVTQVQRLDEQINPVIDFENMSLEEAKAYKIKEIGEVCRAEIYEGADVTLSDGTVKHYTFNAEDQQDVLSAVTLAFAAKTMGFTLDYIPFHAAGQICELLNTASMVAIYMTLQLKLTRLTTKCNMLNCMIRDCSNKDDVLAINWDTAITPEYQERFDTIMTTAIEIAEAMARAMVPDSNEESENENDEPIEE